MQIDTAAAIDLSKEKKQNESSFSDQMKAYIKHPGSGVLALLTFWCSPDICITVLSDRIYSGQGCTVSVNRLVQFNLQFRESFLTSFSDQHIHPDGCFTCNRSTVGNLCSHLSGRICEKRK